MHQQYLSLSPMAGQESFGNPLDMRTHGMMAHTPTTSSMLAALQADTFGTSLDPSANSFGGDAFAPMSFMEQAGTPDDTLPMNSSGLPFSDYIANSSAFDISSAFNPHDMGMGASGTPPSTSSDPESENEAKPEP